MEGEVLDCAPSFEAFHDDSSTSKSRTWGAMIHQNEWRQHHQARSAKTIPVVVMSISYPEPFD